MRKLRVILEDEDGTVLLSNNYMLDKDLPNMKALEGTVIKASNQLQSDVSNALLTTMQEDFIKKKG